jgi:hypothetical protein
MRPAVLVHLLNEVTKHLLRDVEICDHTVLERPNRLDGPGRSSEHALRLEPDGVHLAAANVDCHYRWLRKYDPPTTHVNERVGGSEVHGHVTAAEASQEREKAHLV